MFEFQRTKLNKNSRNQIGERDEKVKRQEAVRGAGAEYQMSLCGPRLHHNQNSKDGKK
jgi:hypothetical protein